MNVTHIHSSEPAKLPWHIMMAIEEQQLRVMRLSALLDALSEAETVAGPALLAAADLACQIAKDLDGAAIAKSAESQRRIRDGEKTESTDAPSE